MMNITLSRLPFMAAEVFNCELSKLTDLFFTSREELGEQAPSSSPKKEIQSSPLPREEEEDNDEQDEDEEDDEED
jgi:hypothetical protein